MFKEKERANDILRYAILMCQGKCCKCPPGVRLSFILHLKDDLRNMNAIWQTKTLSYWINRFLRDHKDALQSEAMITKKRRGVSKGSVLGWYKHIPDGSEGQK